MKDSDERKQCGKRLFWVNCFPPSFHSVGDHAQTLAIQKFLSDHFSDYQTFRFYRTEIEQFFKEKVLPDDLIFIHSSGDFGDLYVNGPKFRKRVISAFPDNRIVQLPVSVHYKNAASFEVDKCFFSDRPNLLILCRSRKGAKLLADNFGCQVRFFPDFTFYLKYPHSSSKRKGILFILRNDNETVFKGAFLKLNKKMEKPFRVLKRIFRKDFHFVSTKLARSFDLHLLKWRIEGCFDGATVYDPQVANVDLTDSNRESYVFEVMDFYSRFKTVVSDRFHGLVFARLTGAETIGLQGKIGEKTIIEKEDYEPYFRGFRKLVFDYPLKKQIDEKADTSNILSIIKSRRSVRKWIEKPVSSEVLHQILEAGVFAPSAANYQGVKFKVVRNPEEIKFLCENTSIWFRFNHPNVVILVFYDILKNGLDFSGWHKRFVWQDTACATMNMMLAAESLGVKSCWASSNPLKTMNIKRHFGLSSRLVLANMLFLGYSGQNVKYETTIHQSKPIKRSFGRCCFDGKT